MVTIEEILPADFSTLDAIGKLRLDVWREEATVDESLFPQNRWLESWDEVGRHWVAREHGEMVGAARLTFHLTLSDNPDGYLWLREKKTVPVPAAHFCKLVVLSKARGKGVGKQLNEIRLQAAREMGARSILVTASEKNARLLVPLGFTDTGIRETFPNRPGFPFRALQCLL